jgi:DNA-binding response OmpR family regulator
MDTILVIDDNPSDVNTLGSALHNQNFNVIFSLNGHDGFNTACIVHPALILLDRLMPDMDGLKVCRLLKNEAQTTHIPIIFLTAMESIENKVEGLKIGACDYITKPYYPEELIARIRTHIELHRHYRNNEKGAINDSDPTEIITRAELRVHKAQTIYLEDLTAILSVNDVAHKIGTHARQLSEDFNRITGKYIQHWLQEKRMEKACNLLLKTEIEISQVAESVGYTSVTTFSNTFRNYFGMPPKEYRQLIVLSHFSIN